MAVLRKFLGGVVSGGLVAGLTLVVVSQLSAPAGTAVVNAREADDGAAVETAALPAAGEAAGGPATGTGAQVGTVSVEAAPAAVVSEGGVRVLGAGSALAERSEGDTGANAAPEPEVAVAGDGGGETLANGPAANQPAETEPAATLAPEAETAEDASTDAGAVVASTEAEADETGPETAQTVAQGEADGVSEGGAAEEVAAVPDVPPSLPVTDAPAQSVPTAGDAAPTPAAEVAVAVNGQTPAAPVAPGADGAPLGAELPPPPPLTPEEEAMLADPSRLLVPGVEAPAEAPAEAEPAAQPVVPEPAPAPAAVAPAEPAPEVQTAQEPAPAPEVLQTEAPEAAPEREPSVLTVDGTQDRLAPDAGLAGAGEASTLPSSPRLITAGEGSLTDRDDTAPTLAEATPAPEESALPEVTLEDAPALERFAAPFANADGKPLFGIVLIDSGDAALDRQAVASLPFPVSIVVDPLSPEAAAHAALYRAGGKEVVMLATGIPDGATPADVEQTFQAHAAALPEAVAVLDASDAAFQNDRPLSSQIVPILAAQGRGLMTWDRGLNAADQVARREGLPSAMIFRQIDAEGESVPVMRRYLDRAAFKAAQDGEVVVVGTMRAETIAAILEWTIEGRASSVALAPASALLGAP